jgi:hypothetical protein
MAIQNTYVPQDTADILSVMAILITPPPAEYLSIRVRDGYLIYIMYCTVLLRLSLDKLMAGFLDDKSTLGANSRVV